LVIPGSPLILGTQGDAAITNELAKVGLQLHNRRGCAAARVPAFEQHTRGDFAETAEVLRVSEVFLAAEGVKFLC
jgi:hypothetical protein